MPRRAARDGPRNPATTDAQRKADDEIHYSQPIETPLPNALETRAVAPADGAAGGVEIAHADDAFSRAWNEWAKAHVDILRREMTDAVGEALGMTRRDIESDLVALSRRIKDAEMRAAELSGAMNVIRSVNGLGIRLRGKYKSGERYDRHDVVVMNGSSFIARTDKPGPCPGPNWALLCSKGGRGERGHMGPQGPAGEPAEPAKPTKIKVWAVDVKKFTATPIMSDGTIGANLELKPLLQEFLNQITASRS